MVKQIFSSILLFALYLTWILYEPIWERCRFRFRGNINEPLDLRRFAIFIAS